MIFLKTFLLAVGTVISCAFFALWVHEIDIAFSLPSYLSGFSMFLGIFFIFVGLFFRIWASYTFYRHRIRVLQFKSQATLIQSGPYIITRNSHYIAITAMFFGFVLLFGSLAGIGATIVLIAIWNALLIFYEEKSLAKTFGQAYQKYCITVPRWFSWKKASFAISCGVLIIIMAGIYGFSSAVCPSQAYPDVQDYAVEIDGAKIFYQIAGNPPKTTLIFLHGWGAKKDDICGMGRQNVTSELGKHFFTVSVELPGLIRSDPPKEIWSVERYAELIHQFIQSSNANQAPIIMGQSFGGGIATTYAALYPDEISKLILVDATQANRPNNFYYRLRFYWNSIYKTILESRWMPFFLKRAAVSTYLGVPEASLTKANIKNYLVMTDIETNFLVPVDYRTLRTPTLMIWGKDDTFATPLTRAEEIAKEIPNAKLVIIDGGHLALYTNTDSAIRAILEVQ